MGSAEEWSQSVIAAAGHFPQARIWSLAERRNLKSGEIESQIDEFGVIRVSGLGRDIDIFRKPNELEIGDFDPSGKTPRPSGWAAPSGRRGPPHDQGEHRSRQDWQDQLFLESLVKKRFRERLPACDAAEARGLLARFVDPEVLRFALDNPRSRCGSSP